ncbi:hypothetical protein CERSUDRAFT_113827 [Gelatoporia subvermispora B]|uniref:Piwi domain-containing protein n=1 Tax=Ceriporiopsis subvermispora (strain B) TaxID=914234 RepID=M2PQ31_CERS8|nr:hypothetical protein CERSUDRAFT_113827 [Gelatoporia subvermispora B]
MTQVLLRRSAEHKPGTRGTRVDVLSNMFRFIPNYKIDFYQYDEAFVKPGKAEPPTIGRTRAQELLYRLQLDHADIFVAKGAYDGRSIIYFAQRIPSGTYDLRELNEKASPERAARLQVKLTEVTKFASRDVIAWAEAGRPDVINMLQIYLRQLPNIKYVTPAHQKNYRIFYTDIGSVPLGNALEAWKGVFQSVRPTLQGLAINVDMTTGIMIQGGSLSDVLMARFSLNNARQLAVQETDSLWRQIRQFLYGIIVAWGGVPGRERQMTIVGLVPKAGDFVFEMKGNDTPAPITIKDYYYMTHLKVLKFPQWPGVRNRAGTIVPIELCRVIPGQLFKGKLPEDGQGRHLMLKMAKGKPRQRLDEITRDTLPRTLNFDATDPTHSGMRVNHHPIQVEARNLQAPRIMFQTEAIVRAGRWNVAKPQLRAFRPAVAPVWGVAIFVGSQDEHFVDQFVNSLVQCLKRLGVQIDNNRRTQRGTGQNILPTLEHLLPDPKDKSKPGYDPRKNPEKLPRFVLVILPESAIEIKTAVKQWGDRMIGISTQCCRIDKVKRNAVNNQYCNNVALKINAKLGGINSIALTSMYADRVWSQQTMIIGADVSHPPPGVFDRPSVSAVVGSMNGHFTTYSYSARAQSPTEEFIGQLHGMLEQLLRDYHDVKKDWPQRIIFFRDGISQGQFGQVAARELMLIRRAFERIGNFQGGSSPKITYIVVTKRHHVRFFPKEGNRNVSNSENCLPGLVVDKNITSPVYFDYFLQSHDALHGTARPSHYTVLFDENEMSADDLQELSFALCHVYASATSAVSIPAPIYYADKVCTHVGAYHFDPQMLRDAAQSQGDATADDGDGKYKVNVGFWNAALGSRRTPLKKKFFFL